MHGAFSQVTCYDYDRDEAAPDRNAIADAIHRRFKERYIDPISALGVHGFTKMAIACLMIEALESFQRGWPDTLRPAWIF